MEDYAGNFDGDGTKVLHSIMNSSKKMGELIDDLLAFSKLGRKQGTVSEINMTSLLTWCVENCCLKMETTSRSLRCRHFPCQGRSVADKTGMD
jgi:light-regulated signal transduction histidine kinase (bacteriophytochrome)